MESSIGGPMLIEEWRGISRSLSWAPGLTLYYGTSKEEFDTDKYEFPTTSLLLNIKSVRNVNHLCSPFMRKRFSKIFDGGPLSSHKPTSRIRYRRVNNTSWRNPEHKHSSVEYALLNCPFSKEEWEPRSCLCRHPDEQSGRDITVSS